ncbi:glycosyltransferase involved in cell wall biosynthesis [Rhodoligotrophos appendicifer]|uniref:glycosyltransferase family 4 protein n=1 Tax=Rhodoligotrophos appendicifer TaxID=987056 RepID=UPI00117FBDB1|nr:glycosyltransferase family 4 protein [Rhodoligotrophos appendicifer]
MATINFISNLAEDLTGGGYSARNRAVLKALRRDYEVRYVGPIDPPAAPHRKLISKALRMVGLPGRFSFYDPARLERIAKDYEALADRTARLDFFHGFTPWILTTPSRPFIAWNDCTFHDYMNIYHDRSDFSGDDLAKIERREATWLGGANIIVFRSTYFAKRGLEQYGLRAELVKSVSNFGAVTPPMSDDYRDEALFLFMSTNFAGKGGSVVLEAFAKVRSRFPESTLAVIGDHASDVPPPAGVEWVGFLRKDDPLQQAKLVGLFSRGMAILHPTMKDTNPAVIIEAAYFGCPAIASRAFAIPEFVEDGRTGLLLDAPRDPDEVAAQMIWMLENPVAYAEMRRAVRSRALAEFTADAFEDQILDIVAGVLSRADRSSAGSGA